MTKDRDPKIELDFLIRQEMRSVREGEPSAEGRLRSLNMIRTLANYGRAASFGTASLLFILESVGIGYSLSREVRRPDLALGLFFMVVITAISGYFLPPWTEKKIIRQGLTDLKK